MTEQQQRNAEIWSTRVQKELLALTTENADKEITSEVRTTLPAFCKVTEHKLSLEQGACLVLCEITVPGDDKIVMVSLDASLARTNDGKIDFAKPAYPFAEPAVILQSGEEMFPTGSTIKNGNRISMDIDWTPSLHLTDAIMNIGLKVKESITQNEPVHAAPTKHAQGSMARVASGFASLGKALGGGSERRIPSLRPNRTKQTPTKKKEKKEKKVATPGEVSIGDEINLLEEPWVNAHGVYSCKAIRRPVFVQQAMQAADDKAEQESFKSPSAMFRTFTQSATRVLEEAFLMITETHIIEVKASKLNMSTGRVCFAIPIDMMAKLKFRRQESVSLFFKPDPDDALIYMCPDSGDAVHQIQAVLKRHGVKGKHTNAAAHRAINEALHLVQEIQTKELALKHDPTVERVNEIMDLYRQAAERFEVAGDIRHEEVVTHMRKFLALPLTTGILDGSYKKPESIGLVKTQKSNDGVPEGEVLERHDAHLDDDDVDATFTRKDKENDKAFEENIENLLKEATADAAKFSLDGDTDPMLSAHEKSLDDVAADLDAMMREADKELAELMSS